MSTDNETPILGLEYVAAQQASPEVTVAGVTNMLEALLHGVKQVGLDNPPGSPAQGDTYVIGGSPTGVWTDYPDCIASFIGSGWLFVPADNDAGAPIGMGAEQAGMRVWDATTLRGWVWNGSVWRTDDPEPVVVGDLPAAATAGEGARGFVTDSTQTLAAGLGTAVVGSGGDKVPVYSDGSSWLIG